MSDPRLTPFNGRVAHVSLRGKIEAEQFVEGVKMEVAAPVAAVLRRPDGARDHELLLGQPFTVIDYDDEYAYGLAEDDGYCGYLRQTELAPRTGKSHQISVRETYGKPTPDMKVFEPVQQFYFASQIGIAEEVLGWSRVVSTGLFVPSSHVQPISDVWEQPIDVARLFLGTPYSWGGGSGAGIDCSGLVQRAFNACGVNCPRDSDMQLELPGEQLGQDTALQANDLIFWKGHVALVMTPELLIHANAHHMSTVEEPIQEAISRIAGTPAGNPTHYLRPKLASVAAVQV